MTTNVPVHRGSVLAVSTQDEWDVVARKAASLAQSDIIPKTYQDNPANVLIAMEMADRCNEGVLTVMQNLYVVHGQPGWSSKFLIARMNVSGRFSPLRYRFVGTEGEPHWGCRAVAKDLSDGEELVGPLVTLQLAHDEGWSTKRGSKWKTMPELMLRYRAAAFFVRVYAPEIAAGIHTVDEIRDTARPAPEPARAAQVGATVLAQEPAEPEDEPVEAAVEVEAEPETDLDRINRRYREITESPKLSAGSDWADLQREADELGLVFNQKKRAYEEAA